MDSWCVPLPEAAPSCPVLARTGAGAFTAAARAARGGTERGELVAQCALRSGNIHLSGAPQLTIKGMSLQPVEGEPRDKTALRPPLLTMKPSDLSSKFGGYRSAPGGCSRADDEGPTLRTAMRAAVDSPGSDDGSSYVLLPAERPVTAEIVSVRVRTQSWDQALLAADGPVPRVIGRELMPGASLRSTVFNLMSTCLGSGMLAFPAMMSRIGLGGGLCLLVLVPIVAERSVWLMLAAADLTGQTSVAGVAEQTLGRNGALCSACALIALPYGVCVSYCVVIKALLPSLLQAALGLAAAPSSTTCLVSVAALLLAPLTSLRTMDQLRFASTLSIVLVYAFVVAVAAAGAEVILNASPETWQAWRCECMHAMAPAQRPSSTPRPRRGKRSGGRGGAVWPPCGRLEAKRPPCAV